MYLIKPILRHFRRLFLLLVGVTCLVSFSPINEAAENDTLTLGAAVSLTGKYSTSGKNMLDGYQLAIQQVNEKGGVKIGDKTYKLAIKYYDDESTSTRAAQLLDRLVNQDGIKYILGPYSSGLTKAMIPITEKYKLPMIEANGADRDMFTQGYHYLFAVLNSSDQYLSGVVDLLAEKAKEQGRSLDTLKIAIVVENDSFSQDVRNGVADLAKKYNMKIVIDEKLPPDLNDMSPTLVKVKALKPDLLIVSGHEKGAALAIRQLSDQQVYVPMVGLTHCDSAQLTEKFGKKSNYAFCASQWDYELTYSDPWFGSAADYDKLFTKVFKYKPPYQAAESSSAVLVMADAFQRAQSLDPVKIRDAIAATDLMTFYGPIKFDATGQNIAKSMVLYQIQDQQFKVVAPTKWSKTKAIYPAPQWDKR